MDLCGICGAYCGGTEGRCIGTIGTELTIDMIEKAARAYELIGTPFNVEEIEPYHVIQDEGFNEDGKWVGRVFIDGEEVPPKPLAG